MCSLDRELAQQLKAINEQGLYRQLRPIEGPQVPRIVLHHRSYLNFSSNDYLGLASHPALKNAAILAIEKYGSGAGASRLISGSLAPHRELEEALAGFKHTEAALAFSSGYATALGTIGALLGRDDIIVLDHLVHASVIDAARLSGAKMRIFAHNDLDDLARILKWATAQRAAGQQIVPGRTRRVLIVTESVFSMDGDHSPLREIIDLKEKHGAWLMVDEAHGTGLYGPQGRGLGSSLGLDEQIDVHMGTLGKALGSSGGYICGSRILIDFLINRARSFIYSTAPTPASAAAATCAIGLVQSAAGEEWRQALWARVTQFHQGQINLPARWKSVGVSDTSSQPTILSAIQPVPVGDEREVVSIADRLSAKGFFVPAIRYPTVARGQARLRVTLTATHAKEDVQALLAALDSVMAISLDRS